jgi:hypothetical protein
VAHQLNSLRPDRAGTEGTSRICSMAIAISQNSDPIPREARRLAMDCDLDQ